MAVVEFQQVVGTADGSSTITGGEETGGYDAGNCDPLIVMHIRYIFSDDIDLILKIYQCRRQGYW
jgi:hypothetical protein